MQITIFITGASSGPGKATARLFQSKGWHVIATMRNPEKETELTALENVIVLKPDVAKPAKIQETVNKVIENHSIDVVLNNAGYAGWKCTQAWKINETGELQAWYGTIYIT